MVRYDDLLNGSAAAPAYVMPEATALPTRPQDGATDFGIAGKGNSSSKTVLIALGALIALLIMGHVLTLSVQA